MATIQGLRDPTDDLHDDDDYFHDAAAALCVPDLPEGLNTESDSIDLDDIPCKIPEEPQPPQQQRSDGGNAATDTASQVAWPRQEASGPETSTPASGKGTFYDCSHSHNISVLPAWQLWRVQLTLTGFFDGSQRLICKGNNGVKV